MSEVSPQVAMTYSAADLAAALGSAFAPTPEQTAVIEAPLGPSVVIAGAGSGKTETMAARVVWLVANGHVQPEEVLGLTFTRKAASELAQRIESRLARLRQAGLWAPPTEDGAAVFGGQVTVSTYHSYAGRLVREHGLRLGHEPNTRLLTDAAVWQYASEAVEAYEGPVEAIDKEASTVTNAVVALAGQLADHLRTPQEAIALLDQMEARLTALPPGKGGKADVAKEVLPAIGSRRQLMPIVAAYQELKRRRDVMDFSDQMAVAARLAMTFEEVGSIERQRFRAVLLDEFQDTSEAQLDLLRALFYDPADPLPVTAVGDPNQAIYGWRGASATTLLRFPDAFDVPPQGRLTLSTSWRNDSAILRVANHTATPLRQLTGGGELPELAARPGAGDGAVEVARLADYLAEADYVARWLGDLRERAPQRSLAVLCRKRSQFGPIMDALDAAEIPYEVVGLGGLLTTPEVEEIVALLHVVADPGRGDQMMRLLTGPVCHLGAADLDGLWAWARWRQLPGGRQPGRDLATDAAEEPSLVEAVADLPSPDWLGRDGERIGEVALARLRGLASTIDRLRRLGGLGLADLVGEAERALGLDIEVAARPNYTPATARAHLDAFAEVAEGFSASADRPTITGFLAWLEAALAEERGLDKGYIDPAPGAVQIMTVHSAKGLEWDAVAIPGLVEASFPAHSAMVTAKESGWSLGQVNDKGWLGKVSDGGLPHELRGDRDGLPELGWRSADSLAQMQERFRAFRSAGGEHAIAEERRLAYVAFTRAKRRMLLTAPVWSTQKTPRITSRFLHEVLDGEVEGVSVADWTDLPAHDPAPTNPMIEQQQVATWPHEPFRARRQEISASADKIAVAMAADPDQAASGNEHPSGGVGTSPDGDAAGGLDAEIDLLLAERDRLRAPGPATVELPAHLSTSAAVALAADRDAYALNLRRPVPVAPARSARRGTAFHAWIEAHYARAAIVDVFDLPGSADESADLEPDLPALQEAFLASPWANATPLEVEASIETVIDGIALRGRVDAIFAARDLTGLIESAVLDPDTVDYVVVDWKTGAPASGAAGRARAVQLSVYAIAYARLHGLDPRRVRGAFFHAATGATIWPDLLDEGEISQILALGEPPPEPR